MSIYLYLRLTDAAAACSVLTLDSISLSIAQTFEEIWMEMSKTNLEGW